MNIEGARNKLMDMLCNYQGYKKCTLILVFDAYKVEGNVRGKSRNITIFMWSIQKKRKLPTSILKRPSMRSEGSIM